MKLSFSTMVEKNTASKDQDNRQDQQGRQGQQQDRSGQQGGRQGQQDARSGQQQDRSGQQGGRQGQQDARSGQQQQGSGTFNDAFKNFSQREDPQSDGNSISLNNINKWLEQSNLLGRQISSDDVSSAFSNVAKSKDRIDINQFQQFLERLSGQVKMDVNNIRDDLARAGQVGNIGGLLSGQRDDPGRGQDQSGQRPGGQQDPSRLGQGKDNLGPPSI